MNKLTGQDESGEDVVSVSPGVGEGSAPLSVELAVIPRQI